MRRIGADLAVSPGPALRVLSGGAAPRGDPSGADAPFDFDGLFRRYAPYVGAIAIRILGRNDEVDDLVQDVFIDAYRGLGGLREPNAVKAWLARVTVRRAHRQLQRHWWRRLLHRQDPGDYSDLADPGATPEQCAEVASAYRLLERLPVRTRIVWVLRQVQGETLERIAELCGCSLSTVQRRLRAAETFMQQAGEND
jgi:RNA polymerase sigma-70 factor (ECF subfamily)